MAKVIKLKIIILGPTSVGKSTISNFLAEVSEAIIGEVRNTRGVRIVEFQIEDRPNDHALLEIELWDCSGDDKYETYWPVFFHEADGMVLVYAKESPEQKKELEAIYRNAVDKSDGLINNTIIFSNVFNEKETSSAITKNIIPNIKCHEVNVKTKSDDLNRIFNNFISEISTKKINTK